MNTLYYIIANAPMGTFLTKRYSLMVGILLLATQHMYAQNKDALKRIESAKIGLITQRLELSPEQATKFWPIYNEYSNKRSALKKELKTANKSIDPNTATERDRKKLVDLELDLKQQDLNLQKEYSNKLLKVISTQQIISLRQAEGDFRKMLFDKLKQRKQQQQKMNQFRKKRNERAERKNN